MIYLATKAKDLHTQTVPDARISFAPVFAFLSRCTDCLGPSGCEGVPNDRLDHLRRRRWATDGVTSTLAACRDLVDELAIAWRPTRIDWQFHFRLLSPAPDDPFVYPSSEGIHPIDDRSMSYLALSQYTSQPTTLALQLVWPVDELDPRFAPARDQAFAALGIKPRLRCWAASQPL